MKKRRVCAIVLDYRAAEKTQECLLSLRNQGLSTVYVLDNSESEPHSAELRNLINGALARVADYRIEILSAGKNLGFAGGVNFVISHDRRSALSHDFYLLLNNDAVAGPGLVTQMLAELQDSSVVLVAPRIVCNDPGRESGIWYHRYLGMLLASPGRFRFHYFTGCCLLLRRELADDNRLFDERFFMYGEDIELAWRLRRQGKKMVCAKTVIVEHEYGPSVDRASFFYEYHIVRGHLLLTFKTWIHPAEIPLLVTAKSLSLACRAVIRAVRHGSLVPLAAFFLAYFDCARANGRASVRAAKHCLRAKRGLE
jgi:GT2 family glycosyltransferase